MEVVCCKDVGYHIFMKEEIVNTGTVVKVLKMMKTVKKLKNS